MSHRCGGEVQHHRGLVGAAVHAHAQLARRRRAALIDRHARVGQERHQAVLQAHLAVGDAEQRAVAAVTVEEDEPLGGRGGDAAADVVEHGQQRRGRQPHRAGRPGVLVRLRVLQRRQQPDVELVADLGDRGLGDRGGDDRVGAQRQVRAVLLDGAEWLDDDAAIGQPLGDLGAGEVGEVALARCHEGTLPPAPIGQNDHVTAPDYDAIVIGAGHNGLVCAAYLARAGLRTLLVEARSSVGGTASSEPFAGGTVNICNCDHITFRTTPVIEELGLADHGLRYIDIDPAQLNMAWDGGPPWTIYHDVEQTIDSLARTYPDEVDGYRRYLKAAIPAVRMVLDNANDPPIAEDDRPARCSPVAVAARPRCCGGAGAALPT